MKTNPLLKTLLIGLLILFIKTASAEEPRIYSAVWLEKGCIALSYFAENDKWIEGEALAGMQVQLWLSGVMSGINAMAFASDPSPELTFPPDGWSGGFKAAPLILEFIKKNPKIPPLAHASSVVKAWYLTDHPDATAEHKGLAKTIIDNILMLPDK